MNAKEHLKFNTYSNIILLAGYTIATHEVHIYSFFNFTLLRFFIGSVVGALLPDTDHPKSHYSVISPICLIHRFLQFIKRILNIKHDLDWFSHGHITHTILINSLLFYFAYHFNYLELYGVAFGYMTHLFLDNITGYPLKHLYFPIPRRRKKKKWTKKKKC